jgi:hypothetical protein
MFESFFWEKFEFFKILKYMNFLTSKTWIWIQIRIQHQAWIRIWATLSLSNTEGTSELIRCSSEE